jgi:hypothetical protein
MQIQMADIHIEVAGNVGWQALDIHLANDLFQDSAALDTFRNSQQLDTHLYVQNLVHGDALQIDVNQTVVDRLTLPIDDHGLGRLLAGDFDIEDCVVAGLGEKYPGNLLGIHLDGHRIVPRTIQHGGNLARGAYPASGILVELALTGLGYDYF